MQKRALVKGTSFRFDFIESGAKRPPVGNTTTDPAHNPVFVRFRRGGAETSWRGRRFLSDGEDATLSADRMHFWPYGLNFDNESSKENDVRHVKRVAALRKDMGID